MIKVSISRSISSVGSLVLLYSENVLRPVFLSSVCGVSTMLSCASPLMPCWGPNRVVSVGPFRSFILSIMWRRSCVVDDWLQTIPSLFPFMRLVWDDRRCSLPSITL